MAEQSLYFVIHVYIDGEALMGQSCHVDFLVYAFGVACESCRKLIAAMGITNFAQYGSCQLVHLCSISIAWFSIYPLFILF